MYLISPLIVDEFLKTDRPFFTTVYTSYSRVPLVLLAYYKLVIPLSTLVTFLCVDPSSSTLPFSVFAY